MLQPHQARLLLILTIWYSQPRGNSLSSTDHSQCLLSSSSSQQSTLVSSSDSHVIPPPTPCHHVIYYVSPASQSGSFMLPIKDYPTTPGNIPYSCYGTEERSAFHVPINQTQLNQTQTQKIHKRNDYPPIVGRFW
ncbi:hypothetical protein TNCV_1063221 [Trichonephila clavipes]|nr:hypothetical protein TNCV_1063221 [Trichonephila clavipes]